MDCRHKGKRVQLRCSYKMIAMPLSKFGKCLNLTKRKKEAINYDWYTTKNVGEPASVYEYMDGLPKNQR